MPTTATSGVYIANVIDGSQIFQIPFIIRNDSSTSDVVFQTADETWQAYNLWGGANLYGGNGPGISGSAYAVSYNRPITARDGSGSGQDGHRTRLFGTEYSAIYWLEQNGYDVSYVRALTSPRMAHCCSITKSTWMRAMMNTGRIANVQTSRRQPMLASISCF